MQLGYFDYPAPVNEPVLSYAPGSPEKIALKKAILNLKSLTMDIPMYINGKEERTGHKIAIHPPHEIKHTLGHFHAGTKKHVDMAIDSALNARISWSNMNWESLSDKVQSLLNNMDKMIRAFVILFLVLNSLNLFSQKEANIWHFGNGFSLNFNSGQAVQESGSAISTIEGSTSFCDSAGNLLFYFNGADLRNSLTGINSFPKIPKNYLTDSLKTFSRKPVNG